MPEDIQQLTGLQWAQSQCKGPVSLHHDNLGDGDGDESSNSDESSSSADSSSSNDGSSSDSSSIARKRRRKQERRARKKGRVEPDGDNLPLLDEEGPLPETPAEPIPVDNRLEVQSVHSGRAIRMPQRFTDFLPHEAIPLRHIPEVQPQMRGDISTPSRSPSLQPVDNSIRTAPNSLGLYRVYPEQPSWNPEAGVSLDSVCDAPTFAVDATNSLPPNTAAPAPRSHREPSSIYEPFSSKSAAILMGWSYSGTKNKASAPEMNRLARDISKLGLKPEELDNFDFSLECDHLDKYLLDQSNPYHQADGWHEATLHIPLPDEGHKHSSEAAAPVLEVPGFRYRRLFDVLKTAFESERSKTFHFTPFEQRYIPDDDYPEESERVHSEIYDSQAMRDAHREINSLPRDPDDTIERVVMPMMFWSDATHLTDFGTASVWPVYLYLGNESKYTRGKPKSQSCHHLAYLPSLPADFQQHFNAEYGRRSSDNVKKHCKREIIQAAWDHLLDEEFMDAYHHGMVLMCADGRLRRFYPRLFTYSADYPEKVLLACIKNLGRCPCTRCLVTKDQIPEVATPADMARRQEIRVNDKARRRKVERARTQMFKHGRSITSKKVEALLDATSLTPTRNAFCKLSTATTKFNIHVSLVVDQLHEVELGIVKAVIMHLLRLCYALGGDRIAILNERYRKIPTFGRDTIRRFHQNVSELKKLAARDFEDIIQCAIPVFDGLFDHPDHPNMNDVIVDLIFCLCTWHAYAKLRVHTDSTIRLFKTSTTALGEALRIFVSEVCDKITTKELPKEADVRRKATTRRAALHPDKQTTVSSSAHERVFNMNTVKLHFIGDYPSTVEYVGPTDNYSTQTGELQHQHVKRRFAKTSKNNFIPQLAQQEARERFCIELGKRLAADVPGLVPADDAPTTARPRDKRKGHNVATPDDNLPFTDPTAHYHIATDSRDSVHIAEWLGEHAGDPAVNGFRQRLVDHILTRVLNLRADHDHEFTNAERNMILIKNNEISFHQVLRVNYTTYDLRRDQDSMNPRTHADVMVLSGEDQADRFFHPYWYARILRVFHVMYQYTDHQSHTVGFQRMDIAWVRWMALDTAVPGGWAARRLHCVGFMDAKDPSAFGFIDPNDVVRGVHIMPAFKLGRTDPFPKPSLARPLKNPDDEDREWMRFYVGMFVDRDMFMRYRGGGIGHLATRSYNRTLRAVPHTIPEKWDDSDYDDMYLDDAPDDAADDPTGHCSPRAEQRSAASSQASEDLVDEDQMDEDMADDADEEREWATDDDRAEDEEHDAEGEWVRDVHGEELDALYEEWEREFDEGEEEQYDSDDEEGY